MEILHCLFKNRLYTNMLRIHLFSIFTIKTCDWLLQCSRPLGLLIVKTLTNVLRLLHNGSSNNKLANTTRLMVVIYFLTL